MDEPSDPDEELDEFHFYLYVVMCIFLTLMAGPSGGLPHSCQREPLGLGV